MSNYPQLRGRLTKLLAKRRNYQQEIKDLIKQCEHVVLYGCGGIFNSLVKTWNIYIGRKIDYCCDSDDSKWGKYFRGVKCLSPQELMAIKDKSAVFVTIGDFEPVFKFLTESGVRSVNLIYKYDLATSEFLMKHDHSEIICKLCQTYEILSDELSRKVFNAVVNRVFGNGEDINIMADVCEKNQYFPSDIIKFADHESFVDVGAFNGDTARDFIERTHGKFDNIFSFEVDAINFSLLRDSVKDMPNHDKIRIFNLGIWDSECDITYSIENGSSNIGEGKGSAHAAPLDGVLKNEKITFIKMDIEGAELQALRGGRNIIKTHKPKLAVCVYHSFGHLWEIPLYIKELCPEYKIYLRQHSKLEYETVCYAVP